MQFTFNFRKVADTTEARDSFENSGFKYEVIDTDKGSFIKKLPISFELPTPTVEELQATEEGKQVLALMLEKLIFETVRNDFDGNVKSAVFDGWHAGQVPDGYAITPAYLLESLVPATSGGSSSVSIKAADIKAFAAAFGAWLQAAGKTAKSVALQTGLVLARFKPAAVAGLQPAILSGIEANLLAFAESDGKEETLAVLEVLATALERARIASAEVTADDL